MKEKFIDDVNQFCQQTLAKDIADLNSIGSFSKDPTLNQHVFKAEATFEEICHIVPDNPLFKPGCLLTSPNGIEMEDDCMKLQCAASESDLDAYVDIGLVKELDELGEVRRMLSSEVVMVIGETIEVNKRYRTNVLESQYKNGETQQCNYVVRHLIQAIDDKTKMFIPTKLFKQNESNRHPGHDLRMESVLDTDYILHLYKNAVPENVIRPLELIKKEQ